MENRIANHRKNSENIYTILMIIHLVGWLFLGFILLIIILDEEFLFAHLLGDNAAIIIFVFAGLCMLSPLYLMFIKKKWLKYLMMYIITVVFIASFLTIWVESINYFNDFTKEKWQEFPQARYYMLDDLKKNHGLIGMDENDVIDLLGSPDTKNEAIFAYYMRKEYKDRVYIQIRFQDGKVISMTYHNLL